MEGGLFSPCFQRRARADRALPPQAGRLTGEGTYRALLSIPVYARLRRAQAQLLYESRLGWEKIACFSRFFSMGGAFFPGLCLTEARGWKYNIDLEEM